MAKKKRSISISLAAKCQLLFGLAVLVIIAGALAVPWQRMEQLAKQPNVKAAKFAADLLFRQIHASAMSPPGSPSSEPPTTQIATAWNNVQLSGGDYGPPRMYAMKPSALGFIHDEGDDGSAAQAIKFFAPIRRSRRPARSLP